MEREITTLVVAAVVVVAFVVSLLRRLKPIPNPAPRPMPRMDASSRMTMAMRLKVLFYVLCFSLLLGSLIGEPTGIPDVGIFSKDSLGWRYVIAVDLLRVVRKYLPSPTARHHIHPGKCARTSGASLSSHHWAARTILSSSSAVAAWSSLAGIIVRQLRCW